jgi:ribosome-binding factor A
LAGRLQTRFTPVLTFVLDQGVKNRIERTRLINEALAEPRPKAPPDEGGAQGHDEAKAGPPQDEPAEGTAGPRPADA